MTEGEKASRRVVIKCKVFTLLLISFVNALVVSLTAAICSGYFAFGSWFGFFLISLVIVALIWQFVPVSKIEDKICEKCKIKKDIGKKTTHVVISSVPFAIIISAIITLVSVSGGIKNAEERIEMLNTEIVSLSEQLETKQGELDDLQDIYDKLLITERYITLQESRARCEEQLAALKDELAALTPGAAAPVTSDVSNVEDIENIESNSDNENNTESADPYATVQSQINELQTVLTNLDISIKEYEVGLNEQKMGISAATSTIDGIQKGLEERNAELEATKIPNLGGAVIIDEIICIIVAIILNFLVQKPLCDLAEKIAKHKKKLL